MYLLLKYDFWLFIMYVFVFKKRSLMFLRTIHEPDIFSGHVQKAIDKTAQRVYPFLL